jgi:winged helix DNA-binding protein
MRFAAVTGAGVELTRAQILGHRLRAAALDERLPSGAASLRRSALAGHSDSMPRGALLSIHARVAGVGPDTWEDPELVQVWGPRFSAYVIAADDRAVFTLGRMPDEPAKVDLANRIAVDLERFLDGRRLSYAEAGRALGMDPNRLRYGSTTGRLLIRWEGAGRPLVWTVPAPAMPVEDARLELARRYLHVLGPGTPDAFSDWAGIRSPRAHRILAALASELVAVTTPIGERWILASDEASFRSRSDAPPSGVRLLPSGDTWFLFSGAPDRELLVPAEAQRRLLWTPRVWPGAVLLDGEIAGTWRRAGQVVDVEAWGRWSAADRLRVEAEAATLPVPGSNRDIRVRWGP